MRPYKIKKLITYKYSIYPYLAIQLNDNNIKSVKLFYDKFHLQEIFKKEKKNWFFFMLPENVYG